MKYTAIFRVYDNPNLAYKCFFKESEKKKRFNLSVKKNNRFAELKINARDTVALKAITNSMVKLLQAYESVQEVEDTEEEKHE